jgi:hypothetical protein
MSFQFVVKRLPAKKSQEQAKQLWQKIICKRIQKERLPKHLTKNSAKESAHA